MLRTPSWDVVQAYGTSLEGWTVLVLRRHVATLAEMTSVEANELGPLVRFVSRALVEVVGCAKTYVAQFAEDQLHRHVHFHIIPVPDDQPAELRGPRVFAFVSADRRLLEHVRDLDAETVGPSWLNDRLGPDSG